MVTEKTTQEAVDLLCQLIKTPRTSREEGAAADLLQQWMEERGMGPQREENNLWCTAPGYDPERKTLLLCAHIDTVRPVSDGLAHPTRLRGKANGCMGWEPTTMGPRW